MSNQQIDMRFPHPGKWNTFILTALWEEDEGYECRRRWYPADIPAEHLATLQGVVGSIVALGEPWTATHVIARQETITPEATEEGQAMPYDVVEMTVKVRRDADSASRDFTSADLPGLRVQGDAALAAFRYFFTTTEEATP